MTYERFKELWNALVTNRPASSKKDLIDPGSFDGMNPKTSAMLIALAKGDRSLADDCKRRLKETKELYGI